MWERSGGQYVGVNGFVNGGDRIIVCVCEWLTVLVNVCVVCSVLVGWVFSLFV